MKKYNIEIKDPNEKIEPIHLPYDNSKLTRVVPCPYDENYMCEVGNHCLTLMNDKALIVCTRYKGKLP